ncbi:hypothetical protein [Zoogloea sp.]|uniref:hypothetical protein n=1 Tax=Zoogloea sp. TaxID=49181 RepID=UPI00261E400C|nr:hypothetical protein [Zoogloea sp.]MDD3354685.1 hypothetical protein [Zoogloea sp.]
MRLSRFSPVICLVFLGLPPVAALAQQVSSDPVAEMARAQTLRSESAALRGAAESRFRAEEVACYERFLVNRCIDQARSRRVTDIRRAREMELEAGRLELADRNRAYAERQAELAAQAPEKSAGRAAEEARLRAEGEARLKAFAEKDAERITREQAAKTRGMEEAEARHRKEAEQALRRAREADAAASRAEQARQDRLDYEERLKRAEEKRKAQ